MAQNEVTCKMQQPSDVGFSRIRTSKVVGKTQKTQSTVGFTVNKNIAERKKLIDIMIDIHANIYTHTHTHTNTYTRENTNRYTDTHTQSIASSMKPGLRVYKAIQDITQKLYIHISWY